MLLYKNQIRLLKLILIKPAAPAGEEQQSQNIHLPIQLAKKKNIDNFVTINKCNSKFIIEGFQKK